MADLIQALQADMSYLDHSEDDIFLCSQCSRNRIILTAFLMSLAKVEKDSASFREGLLKVYARIPEFTCSYKHTTYSNLYKVIDMYL